MEYGGRYSFWKRFFEEIFFKFRFECWKFVVYGKIKEKEVIENVNYMCKSFEFEYLKIKKKKGYDKVFIFYFKEK